MSARFSTLARNGSNVSSSSAGSSTALSLNDHPLSRVRAYTLSTWSTETNHYERIATGTMRLGMAVLTREMMEMHIQHAPDVRGMLDCLPVASTDDAMFVGWRKKTPTWPVC